MIINKEKTNEIIINELNLLKENAMQDSKKIGLLEQNLRRERKKYNFRKKNK